MGLFDWFKKDPKPIRRIPSHSPLPQGDFDAGSSAIQIHYTNFEGQNRIIVGDAHTAYKKGRHIVLRVVPTGKYISLNLASIQNRAEIDSHLENDPHPMQRSAAF